MKGIVACSAAIGMTGALLVPADSIRVGGQLYEDVYIGTTKTAYYVHFPEEGRVEKVSRARKDVELPVIDADTAGRERLRERYEARKAENESALATASPNTLEADAETYLRRKSLCDIALFESQLEHWRALSPEQQQGILDEVLALSVHNAEQRAGDQLTIQGRLEHLEAAKTARQAEIAGARAKRDAAIEEAERRNLSDVWLGIHEEKVVGYQRGNNPYLSDFWLRQADTDEAVAARRKAAAQAAYARDADGHARELGRVEAAITQREREAIATENKARDAERRYGAYLARIDELIGASEGGYSGFVSFDTVETWRGDSDLRTPAISIEGEVWRVECRRNDFGLASNLKVTVFDAETDTPVKVIADKDFLQMYSLVLDRPGRYYFTVKQDQNRIPWELNVSGITARE